MKWTRIGGWVSVAMVLMVAVGGSALAAGDSPFFTSEANVSWAQGVLVGDGYLDQGSFERGSLDHATRNALKQYQSDHALNVHGALDEETFQSLTSHETSYPWGGAPEAAPIAVAVPAENEPTHAVEVAEAPEVPEPAPAPSPMVEPPQEKEAPAEEAAPAMPATGSNLLLLALSGLALLGTGTLLLRRSV
ncbi:MAG TPA: peptidoglycan-binding domain-containing protein [Candidatus Polarisedimenticolia bacterium]|nr:peptidoglycan-binding domain-containing protein [Candidatus Polarisedimenticolia bacterium]